MLLLPLNRLEIASISVPQAEPFGKEVAVVGRKNRVPNWR